MKGLPVFRSLARPCGWLFGLLILLLAGCEPLVVNHGTQLEQIQARGELTVGVVYGSTSYFLGNDGPQGFDYEMAEAFASYLGVGLKVEPVYTTADLLKLIDEGHIDVAATSLTVTDARLQHYRFSPSYKKVDQLLVYRNGSPRPRNLGELKGVLKVVAGSSHVDTLTKLQESYPGLSWQESTDQQAEELLDQVAAGEIAYSVIDSARLENYRRYQPDLAIAFQLATQEPVAWVIGNADDDSLFATLIEFFGEIRGNGTLATIDERYFGHLDQFNYVDVKAFIAAVERRLPRYRPLFKKYAGDFDWRLLAAISYQESMWRPDARSPTGVEGLMMLTLNTAKHLGVSNRNDPEQAIAGGAKYLAEMVSKVPEKVPQHERVWYALASYNIGIGHVIDAIRITKKREANPDSWRDVKESLGLLRSQRWYSQTSLGYARGDVAVKYVDAIRRYYDLLVYIDDRAAQSEAREQQRAARQGETAQPLDQATIAEIEAAGTGTDEESSLGDGP